MGQVVPLAFKENLVRAIEKNGEPWFVGKDVCNVLELKNVSHAISRLDEDEKGITSNDTLGGEQSMIIVSEAGVYRLVFTSRKPEAEEFKRWLAHEVLPKLRRDGFYGHKPEPAPGLDSEPIATLNVKLATVREARIIFGPAYARDLWSRLGLPTAPLPASDPGVAEQEATACLNHLLARKITHGEDDITFARYIERAIEGDGDAQLDLMLYGIRIEEKNGKGWFWVSSYGQRLTGIYQGTPWAGRWRFFLKRLPGAVPKGYYKVDKQAQRGVLLTDDWLEPFCGADAQPD